MKLPVRVGISCAVLLAAALARADATPMMQFNAKIERWLSEQQEPPPLTSFVEGIVKASSSERLILDKCPRVTFQLKTKLPVMSRKRPTAELTDRPHFCTQKGAI